ncbi:hypothetical protein NOR_04341 [Metarhizium rileyi]|uniref:Uncharacterized protein n=1 Tax=Metarhizium rileyi (strain RCEF 4871) TaxID=1649241 RepID=A0A167EE56_METRR|nr:hypothetical protein NOR_04341 [Metarhizium rileyi RCEF 4871]
MVQGVEGLNHGSTVKNRPHASPDTKRCSGDDGKADMVDSPGTSDQNDKASGEKVAQPDAEPGLPPGQTTDNHGRRYHPGVDVEAVGQPETHIVPWTPLSPLLLNGFEVMVDELRQRDKTESSSAMKDTEEKERVDHVGSGTRGAYHELGRSDTWLGRDFQYLDPSA